MKSISLRELCLLVTQDTGTSNNSNKSNNGPIWPLSPITVFTGTNCPRLFLIILLAKLFPKNRVTIDIREYTVADLLCRLSSTFLGTRQLFWLQGFEELDQKAQEKWYTALAGYTGVNYVAFFTQNMSNKRFDASWSEVIVPARTDIALFEALNTVTSTRIPPEAKSRINGLCAQTSITITIDTAYLLSQYIILAGDGLRIFLTHWLYELVVPEASLFTLSSALFARDRAAFFKCWSGIHDVYPVQFWITFWSEQLFRASQYVACMKREDLIAARAIGNRLPFSFLRGGWRSHNADTLAQLHQELISIDEHIKQGSDDILLDLFYEQFLDSKS